MRFCCFNGINRKILSHTALFSVTQKSFVRTLLCVVTVSVSLNRVSIKHVNLQYLNLVYCTVLCVTTTAYFILESNMAEDHVDLHSAVSQ